MENTISDSLSARRGLLDRLAISMAVVCGIHCLVTPILLVALPIIGTTFWVDKNFHLWMLFLVIPTTCLALFSGCRRHKDRWVLGAGALGLSILLTSFTIERVASNDPSILVDSETAGDSAQYAIGTESETVSEPHVAGGGCCALHPAQGDSEATEVAEASGIASHALLNALGGLILVVGHSRNFMLCRKAACRHNYAET